jgi:hypothetical protein
MSIQINLKNTAAAAITALTLGASMAATTTDASAAWRPRHYGGAIAAGVVGGLALGALVGSSRSSYAEPVYVEEAPSCYKVRKQVWSDYHGGYVVRRVTVCD